MSTDSAVVPTPPTAPVLRAGDLSIELTASGDVRTIRAGDLLVNQFLAGTHDTMPSGVFLRRHTPTGIEVSHIVGSAPAVAEVLAGTERTTWTGRSLDVDHRVDLTVDDSNTWVWRVTLAAAADAAPDDEYDVVVAQDMALSPPGTALSSEPYVCQYLVHRRLDHPSGPALASRQTMTAGPRLPLVVSGIVEGAASYATDGMQTHTPLTRLDGVPHGLTREVEGRNYQYELSMPTLVSHRLRVEDGPVRVHAYAVFQDDVPGPLADQAARLEDWSARALEIADRRTPTTPLDRSVSSLRGATLLAGRDVTDEELLSLTATDPDDVLLPETDDEGRLLSFFTPTDAHVVRGAKDLMVERSHGHVLKAGDDVAPNDDILSTTAYAPGVFASHVVVGNTSFNRVVTVQRHHLNLLRTSGVRVWVGPDAATGLRLLGLPSIVTFDLGGVHWTYLTDLGRIDVRTVAAAHAHRIDVVIETEHPLHVVATVDVEPGDEASSWTVEHLAEDTVRLAPSAGSTVEGRYPDLSYLVGSTAPITGDAALRSLPVDDDAAGAPRPAGGLLVTATTGRRLALTVTASLDDPSRATGLLEERRRTGLDVEAELSGHRETLRSLALGLRLGGDSGLPTDEINALTAWYVHDALIHFLVPHGLEQYSGAAWGTRDVCQGPFELHLAFGRFDVARQVLTTTFAHQNRVGDFPQWFMFDAFTDAYSDDAHGDVPVWPLFALGQYLRATGDIDVMGTQVPFWDETTRGPGDVPVPLAVHVERLLDYLDEHRLPGTALPAYGHGDWDDTLQPAEADMRTTMASTWTSALLGQAAQVTSDALRDAGESDHPERYRTLADRLATLSFAVREDVRAHMLTEGVLSGYLSRAEGHDTPVIHPSDERTGISYRLIPMTRSIIAGILDPVEAADHERVIRENLHFPDGVRLMNHPAAFDDGVPHVFLRAEQAANVGREIGLMYTHAHIRWVEALAALGREDTLAELVRISPLGINSRLPHAARRQRNVYYSSSDAAFDDRYAFAEGFDLLRTGEVPVKGGWRVYSSGPGIYLRQLVQGVLGLTVREDRVVFDPVLPPEADGLTVDVDLAGERRTIRYRVGPGTDVVVSGGREGTQVAPLAGEGTSNRYRTTGVEVLLADLARCDVLEVRVPTRD